MVEVSEDDCGREEESPDGIDTDGAELTFLILAPGYFKYDELETGDTGPEQFVGEYSCIVDTFDAPTIKVELS